MPGAKDLWLRGRGVASDLRLVLHDGRIAAPAFVNAVRFNRVAGTRQDERQVFVAAIKTSRGRNRQECRNQGNHSAPFDSFAVDGPGIAQLPTFCSGIEKNARELSPEFDAVKRCWPAPADNCT
jgi:hypothetical protein